MTHQTFVGQYDLNDMARFTATFVGTDGITVVSPSQVFLLVKNPLGTVATYLSGAAGASISILGAGAYARDMSLEIAGDWFYRWQATGVGQSAEEWRITVRTSSIL